MWSRRSSSLVTDPKATDFSRIKVFFIFFVLRVAIRDIRATFNNYPTMPRIKESSIQDVLERSSIVDVVSPYVQLKRAGSKFRGLSPFNPEKTPSFYITPEKNAYYCFSSGQGGGIVKFVQEMQNLNYPETIEFLAKHYNIELEYEAGSAKAGEAFSLKREILHLHEYATDWFVQQFQAQTQDGEWIRDYWTQQRKFSPELAKEFQIGYAPAAPETALGKYLLGKKFSREAMDASGLFYFERNGQWISRFQGRLMIPIRDIQSRVIAFTARQTEKTPTSDKAHEAKYVNSPETPIFQKGKILFGLHHARQHLKEHENSFLLVEGQLDAMRCWEQGLNHAVAPQGTALTEDQIYLLKRYSPSSIHCFLDGDSAGQKAGYRNISICVKGGLDLFFLPLPEGEDPDDFLQKRGTGGFNELLANKLPAMKFAVQFVKPDAGFETPQQRTGALQEMYSLIQEAESITTQDGYLSQISRLLGADETAVRRDYGSFQKRRRSPNRQPTESENNSNGILTNVNFDVLCLILLHPEFAERIAESLDPSWIDPSTQHASLLRKILVEIREGMWIPSDDPQELTNIQDEQNLCYRITALEPQEEPSIKFHECLKAIQRNHLKQQEQHLADRMNQTPEDDRDALQTIQQERNKIRKLLKQLQRSGIQTAPDISN